MSIESKLLKHIAFPLNDIVRGTHSVSSYRELENTQWLSSSKVMELQEEKLHALLVHAYNNVPYYRKMFNDLKLNPSDIRSIEDLSKLPFLTKGIIRKNSVAITSSMHNKKIKFLSGGTTGKPLVSFKDKNAISCGMGAAFRSWSWAGYSIGDKYAMLWRSPETSADFRKPSKYIANIVRRNLFLYSFDLSEEVLSSHVKKMRKFKPEVIRASPSGAYALAEFMKCEGVNDIQPLAILTTAEKLYDFQRKVIESQFKCKIFDSYGSNEIRSIAFECEEHSGYHISAENVIVEFIKNGENVDGGELGEIVITDLTNYAMPFIRYKIGDVGRPSDETCSCGRGLPLMKSIEGRTTDLIVTPHNRVLSGYFFIGLLKQIDFIKYFQVIQETKNNLLVKIVCKSKPTEEKFKYLLKYIQDNTDNMEITIEYVDVIPPAKSGKLQLIISKHQIKL